MNLSLPYYNECPRLYNIFLSFWRHGTILPPRNCLLHDLISRVFLRSFQYGIVVLGFLDALVYAHHKHRLDSASAGSFGDCLRGSVRFMTAITPACAHAYQTICLAMHSPGVHAALFDFLNQSPGIHFFPMYVPLQEKLAMSIMGGLSILMVVLTLLTAKSSLDGV